MSSKYLGSLFKCHNLIKEIIEIKYDIFNLLYDFPFDLWDILLFFRTNVFMHDMSDELLEVKNEVMKMNNLLSIFVRPTSRTFREDIFTKHFISDLYEDFFDLLDHKKEEKLEDKIKKLNKILLKSKRDRALIALYEALTKFSWLAFLFTFKIKEAENLDNAISKLRNREFDESFKLSKKSLGKVKYLIAKSLIEKGIIYLPFPIIGWLIWQTPLALCLAILALFAMFIFLPYYSFQKFSTD